LSAITLFTITLGTKAFLFPGAVKEVVPDFEEKSAVVRRNGAAFCVMKVVLKGGVDVRVMCIRPVKFIAPMQVNSIAVKENNEFKEHKVHVRGETHRDENKWGRANELIC